MNPGQVLCVRLLLPFRNFRQLPWFCIQWLFSYQVRQLSYIWITALQKVIYVIRVVQFLLFFPEWPARCWVWLTTTVLLLFQLTFLTIPMWKPIICHKKGCFWSGILYITLPKQNFNFWVYEGWICWHLHIPCSVSSITPRKIHYLWGSWGMNAFNHPWTYQVSNVLPPHALVPLILFKFLT